MMKVSEIEQRRDVWVYRPATHKTEYRGQCRVICLGPRAQKVLTPFMGSKGFLFSPAKAMKERNAEKRGRRKTRVQPSQLNRRKEKPLTTPGESYSTMDYGQAINYAVRAARRSGVAVEFWSPNQLRHACGTRIRRKFGIDAARAVLGHSDGSIDSRVTDIYTRDAIEREIIKTASRAMLRLG